MKSLKKLSAIALSAAMLAGCSNTSKKNADVMEAKTYKIGLAQLLDHTSLNIIRDTFMKELEALEKENGETYEVDYQNAAGQQGNLDTIMSTFVSDGDDAIVAIATPTAQAAQNYAEEIPVVFSAVSDPEGAGLVESIEEPGGNITGTSNQIQVDQMLDLILDMHPDTKTIGILSNQAETNSQANIQRFKDFAEKKGIKIIEANGTDQTSLDQAETSLIDKKVDILFTPNDNTVAGCMRGLSQIALDAKVPYFVGADSMVMDGGLATVSIDYEELGKETARMVVDVVNGKDPAKTPVKIFKDDLNIYVNTDALKTLGITLPEDIVNNEHLVEID